MYSYVAFHWPGQLLRRIFPPKNMRKNFIANLDSHRCLAGFPCGNFVSAAWGVLPLSFDVFDDATLLFAAHDNSTIFEHEQRVQFQGLGRSNPAVYISHGLAKNPWNLQSGGSLSLRPPTSQDSNAQLPMERRSVRQLL
jgi:hypothetical protein